MMVLFYLLFTAERAGPSTNNMGRQNCLWVKPLLLLLLLKKPKIIIERI